jgi:hypothetical protein
MRQIHTAVWKRQFVAIRAIDDTATICKRSSLKSAAAARTRKSNAFVFFFFLIIEALAIGLHHILHELVKLQINSRVEDKYFQTTANSINRFKYKV